MGKSNPRKKLWKEAVKVFIQGQLDSFGAEKGKLPIVLLDILATVARSHKTAMERHKTWYEGIRDFIVHEMFILGLHERTTEKGSTHYMLKPDLKMESGNKGKKKFERLIALFGAEAASKLVRITRSEFPAFNVDIFVSDPNVNDGEMVRKTGTVKACVEYDYEFVGKGSTSKELFWTFALGNKPSFEVGPVPKRVKAGKERKTRKR